MFSDPVIDEKFFGRIKPLDLLYKRVNGLKDGYRQNIAIVGPKLIGKSSLILRFFSNFNHSKIIPIYIDLKPRSFNHFTYKFIGSLIYQYLKKIKLEVSDDLETLKKFAQDYIPRTVEQIRIIENDIKNLQFNKVYRDLLSLTGVLRQESGIHCVVTLDEFHLLETYKLKEPYAKFAKEVMMQKDTMYILISSQISYARKILANEISLLFGNFEIIYLEPFNYVTCYKFLEKRFQNINLSKSLRDFLISFSKGYPFYLDILSNKIKEKAKELNRTEISRGLVSQALNALIYDSKGILNQYFTSLLSHNLNGSDYSSFLPILLSTSDKGVRLSEISTSTNRQINVISKQINKLLEKDLLVKVGIFYRIQDKMFRLWLKSTYQRKNLSLTADPAVESKKFTKEIEDEISSFSQENRKQPTERVIELLESFRNEIVTIQNKQVKFWHFDEVCLWSKYDRDCIIAHYKNGSWISLVKKEIDEAQIQRFYNLCRRSKYKIRKMIIVTLKEMSLNTRLMALEKKIWIWPLSDLNLLLDLYGKQQIVEVK